MNVAYICADPGVPVFGSKGASVHVQEILRAFIARGDQVRLYCVRAGDAIPADLADVSVDEVRVASDTASPSAIERTAAREQAQREAAAVLASRVIADGADLIYERYSLFSTAATQASGALDAPAVLEVNAPLIDEQREHRHLVDEAGARHALATQLTAASSVTCVSEPVRAWVTEQARTLRVPLEAGRLVVVPNGVNCERIRPAESSVRDDHAGEQVSGEVIFVGTLKPWHGVEYVIHAAAMATQQWHLTLVGDGPQREQLESLAQQWQVPVTFTGAVAPEAIPALLRRATVAVAPYPAVGADAHYFSPLKVVEYAAAGLAVVASSIGQIPTLVQHGHTGLLVPPADPAALAQAVDQLVADPATARTMGMAGRAQVQQSASWRHVLARSLSPVHTTSHTTLAGAQ